MAKHAQNERKSKLQRAISWVRTWSTGNNIVTLIFDRNYKYLVQSAQTKSENTADENKPDEYFILSDQLHSHNIKYQW